MRLFIALPLTDEARRGVRKVVKHLERGRWPIRWEPEKKWHVTLKFLGDEKPPRLDFSGVKPFELKFKGLGSWPDLLLPKVIWLGLKGDLKSFYKLAKSLTDEVVRPHLTLGRIKPEMKRKQRLELGKIISKNRILEIPQTWLVDKVVIYESRLSPSGSQYRALTTFNLTG